MQNIGLDADSNHSLLINNHFLLILVTFSDWHTPRQLSLSSYGMYRCTDVQVYIAYTCHHHTLCRCYTLYKCINVCIYIRVYTCMYDHWCDYKTKISKRRHMLLTVRHSTPWPLRCWQLQGSPFAAEWLQHRSTAAAQHHFDWNDGAWMGSSPCCDDSKLQIVIVLHCEHVRARWNAENVDVRCMSTPCTAWTWILPYDAWWQLSWSCYAPVIAGCVHELQPVCMKRRQLQWFIAVMSTHAHSYHKP